MPPIAKVWPLRICARFASGAFGSKPAASAISLRIEISMIGLSMVLTIASSLCPLRRRPRQRQSGNLAEVGAAGDHRIGRADTGDDDALDPEAVLFPEAESVGDIARGERKSYRRQRHRHIFERLRAQAASPPHTAKRRKPRAQRRIIPSARASIPAPPARRDPNS